MAHREVHLIASSTRVTFFAQHRNLSFDGVTLNVGDRCSVAWKHSYRRPYGMPQNGRYTIDKLYTEADEESFVKFKGYVAVIPLEDIVVELVVG